MKIDKSLKERKAGILMPIASLPNRHGIGDFGMEAFDFANMLQETGFSYWQILPLAPLGYGHSPYQPFSSMAIDELYVSLDLLAKECGLKAPSPFHEDEGKILYEEIRPLKRQFLLKAYAKMKDKEAKNIDGFMKDEPWAYPYAVFMTFKEREGMVSWENWDPHRRAWIGERYALSEEDEGAARFHVYVQMILRRQWKALHEYANAHGIRIIGDLPFYVGFDSLDVWANQDLFLLKEDGLSPKMVAGVPPDYFSATGQRWGNPIYDWKRMEEQDFAFLKDRIRGSAKIYDIVRLDHFRAFDTYYVIPSHCQTAIEGKWVEAPGYAFFDSLFADDPSLCLIAEDLGEMRDEVFALRDHYRFPGMNVIEFTFEDAEMKGLHKKWDAGNMVCYLGTHDNDTIRGFLAELETERLESIVETMDKLGFQGWDIADAFVGYAMHKRCRLCILSMQDILDLGTEARLNVPSTINDVNWTWRMASFDAFEERLSGLRRLIEESHRL